MSEENKRLAKRWFEEVWNQGRREAIEEMMAPDCVVHDAGTILKGIAEFQAYFDRLHGAFAVTRLEIQDCLAEGDLACVRWKVRVRHVGDGLGLPATGKELHTTGISVIRFDRGKLAERWQNWDMLSMLQQMQGGDHPALYMANG